MKHFRLSQPRLPVFVVDPPCRDSVKEWRRERWQDWQEANGRSCGGTGSHRDLQFVYLNKARDHRRSGCLLLARLSASCSREERLRAGVIKMSPMAWIERRRS